MLGVFARYETSDIIHKYRRFYPVMTTRQLRAITKRMGRLIGLEGWTINVEFSTQQELGGNDERFICGDSLAMCLEPYPEARIRISPQQTEREILETIGHELGHIRFDPSNRLQEDTAFELGLDAFGRVLADIEEGTL